MPGRLIHTTEILVHLGEAYYAERSAAQVSSGAPYTARSQFCVPSSNRARTSSGIDAEQLPDVRNEWLRNRLLASAAQALQVLARRQAGLAESLTDAKSELRLFQERVRAVQQVRLRACRQQPASC